MPKRPSRRPRFNPLVVALVYDGLCAFEFACAAELFGLPRPELGPGWYRFETCSLSGRRIRGQYGVEMTVNGGLELLKKAGTIIIPGWQGPDVPAPSPILDALREAHERGARLLSICSGAFVLAAAGLLDGRRATTHWKYARELQTRYPRISVDDNVLYVDEGLVLTSAGSAAGLDLCLHLVRRDFGTRIANQVARRLVIAPHRDGGQAQFLDRPVAAEARNPLSGLLAQLQLRLEDSIPVSEMARSVAMSERTFIRRFRAATAMTPLEWLVHARLERAKQLLEETPLSIDQVAFSCGFGTAITMRHHFRAHIGLSPVEYRKRFSSGGRQAAP